MAFLAQAITRGEPRAAYADTITHGTTTINMDFVTVGDPGNPPDTGVMIDGTTGYGSVDYTYRIGKYEVSTDQWNAVVAADTSDILNHLVNGGFGDRAVTAISWSEVAMLRNWLTSGDVTQGAYEFHDSAEVTGIDRDNALSTYGTVYVIPTEDEWYKAAYYDPSKPGGAGYWDYPTKHDDPNVPASTDAVFLQSYPNDVYNAGVLSAYGTMGQGGNASEWNELGMSSDRGVRGGDCRDYPGYMHASSAPLYSYPNRRGFRVASIPEPGSITLLVCGLVAGLAWWRRWR
jgi:formylglycine-generating enzyme required for sulfatase activity